MDANLHILNLVSTALGQRKLLGVSEMLRSIADTVGAYGCALWQVAPGADLKTKPPRGVLFVSAEWFRDSQRTARHDLPIHDSVTGMAVSTNRIISIRDVHKDTRSLHDPFMLSAETKAMCSLPITFSEGTRGALNIYRSRPFTKSELAQVEQLSSLVPTLDAAIRDRASLSLLGRVSECLHRADVQTSAAPLPKEEVERVLQQICDSVAEAFQCLEASIFLENRLETPNQYRLMATTWPISLGKPSYRASDASLTGWVLQNALPVKIFDLAHFEREQELILREYPGLKWADSMQLDRAVRKLLKVDRKHHLPPLSFMAAPIVGGDHVYGAIRCCVMKRDPYYFAEREVSLLKLVAEQISRYWSVWLGRHETEEENRSWRALVKNISELNGFVHKELNREQPDERRIFAKALRASSIIPGAEIMGVRQYDEANRELYFAEVYGDAWSDGPAREERMLRRYPVTGYPPRSAGAQVLQTGKLYEITDAKHDPYYSEMFPQARQLIIAPIKIEDKKFGVLDIRGTGDRPFPPQAKAMAALLGHQLGMYSYLAATIGELRRTKAELSTYAKGLENLQEQQIQTFQDLEHQIKTPIMQAHTHVQSALYEAGLDPRLRQRLWAIRGLCAKAKRISRNIELFSSLARGEPIPLKISSSLKADELIRLLIEAAEDNRITNSRGGAVDFHVDRESFERTHYRNPPVRELLADKDLLEQAITDVLDNAGKYSFPRTEVRISGGRTGTGGFSIAFENQGIPIHANEVRRCTERGWKSEKAQEVSDTGSGIGLWIVSHIMKAHGGQVVIEPTTRDYVTTVRLIFPANRAK